MPAHLRLAFAMLAAATFATAPAADKKPTKEPERKGPFASMPAPDPAFIAKLQNLGDSCWVNLGSPAADPTWGCGTGRSWSPKMAYAPDLHGAFLFGEANHAYVIPKTRRRADDLWFYHSPSNKWICVHPGTNVDNPQMKINKDGFESTMDGVPCPILTMVHGYCAIDYDSDTHQFVHMPQEEKCFPGELGPHLDAMRKNAEGQATSPSPWLYDTMNGHWMRKNSAGGTPDRPTPSALLFYLPTKKCVWFHDFAYGRNKSGLYDVGANKWTLLGQGTFNQPVAGSDALAYYDSKRHRIDLLRWDAHWIFEADTMQWREAKSTGLVGAIGYAGTWTYDSVNDVGVLAVYREPAKMGLYIYDPEKNAWTKSATVLPGWSENSNAFYDPELNVHFVYNARDNEVGSMWAYRYKKPAQKSKAK